jgi:hypothetical protein
VVPYASPDIKGLDQEGTEDIGSMHVQCAGFFLLGSSRFLYRAQPFLWFSVPCYNLVAKERSSASPFRGHRTDVRVYRLYEYLKIGLVLRTVYILKLLYHMG